MRMCVTFIKEAVTPSGAEMKVCVGVGGWCYKADGISCLKGRVELTHALCALKPSIHFIFVFDL